MKKSTFFLLSLIFLCVFNQSCDSKVDSVGAICGSIYDADGGNSISEAIVVLSPGGFSSITNTVGYFEFRDVEPGTYSIRAQANGYVTNANTIVLTPGETRIVDVFLRKRE